MKFWLLPPFLPTADLQRVAEAAEDSAFEGMGVGDHVCVPIDLGSDYPYTGRQAVLPPTTEFPDPLILAAGLTAMTPRLRFMTYTLLVPLRHPVLLAKQIATVAQLSGGRLDLGVGVGWMREEFDAVGIPFEERGARMDESLEILRALWSGEPVDQQGDHYHFAALNSYPVPPAPIRVLVGGHSAPALRRAARLGDGWVGVNPTFEDLTSIIERLEVERSKAGTNNRPFEIRTGVKGKLDVDAVKRLADLGVDATVVLPWQIPVARQEAPTAEAVIDAIPRLEGLIGAVR